MNLHVLQHVPFEGPAQTGAWAAVRGHRVTSTRWFADERPPALQSVDLLVVMGGPMSVYEEHLHPWLREEKHFIRQAIASGKRILGVCLGAQLLADVLGARVYPHTQKEIGWFPVQRTADVARAKLFDAVPEGLEVFHWHGDTFDIPPGAVHALRSEACPNQAFSFEDRVVGLQFHIEIEAGGVAALIEQCPGDLRSNRYVQSAAQMRSDGGRYARIHGILDQFLDDLVRTEEGGIT
jgi:GMP synthase-like glutamine amidotransferase